MLNGTQKLPCYQEIIFTDSFEKSNNKTILVNLLFIP